ncbi:hypothetical protein GobsT_69270 [Gemmata obscuriglobus]|uniref:CobQ/CobB/MinD/ParA nucleotide binding domain-containing protein n=1 Tax=Gemmata obscuriglobus TaxID=114 RepID=A0A2Z3HJD3_9BACT|nr:hypothetical protein [Gemmata obscuriglobus]AWM41944.1 hypothetical protein C1280_36430 [Gemmata obscuriglobus]QEG32076.1 hypothetical protein GobsT_69270 [Gemmata obscuriglobus]VTS11429.1 Cobyrinic acid a,c-diamide synthase OS=Nostoc sp. PCC 7107 GN=Nos7107_1238 PE=4 SV=1 [Gemmata obscuriglobus UQM 2246]
MHKIVSVHSPAGANKCDPTAHIAAAVARLGMRVGVIEIGAASTGLRALFNLDPGLITHTLGDHLTGRCALRDAAYRVSLAGGAKAGSVHLIPSGPFLVGYDAEAIGDALGTIADALSFDFLFVNAPVGLDEDALLIAAAADWAVLVLRPNRQEYQAAAVAVEVVRRLGVPHVALVLSEVPCSLDHPVLQRDLTHAFGVELGAVLPLVSESPGPAAAHLPEHSLARVIAALTA